MLSIKLKYVIILLQFSLFGYSQVLNICSGDTIDFNSIASSPTNFIEWEFILDDGGANIISGQNTESLKVLFENPGNYILQFREYALSDCYGIVEKEIEVFPNPFSDFSSNSICIFDSVTFTNNSTALDGIESSIWRIGDFVFNGLDFTYTFDEEGDYAIELKVVSTHGCADQSSLIFKLSDKPNADFYFSPQSITTLNNEVSFINLSTNAEIYNWSFGDSLQSQDFEPTNTYFNAGSYIVKLLIEDQLGCKDSISKSLLVENELIYYLPTSFTPDGDGVNDFFGIRGFRLDSYQEFSLDITNRWGDKIFSTNDVYSYWDGKSSDGSDIMSGLYFWTVTIKDELGKLTKEIGEVTLLR